MTERVTAAEGRINWRLPLAVAAAAGIVLLLLMIYSPYGDLLYILFIAPIVLLLLVILLLVAAVRKRPRQCLSLLLTMVAFLAVSGALHVNKDGIRGSLRWLL